MQIKFYLEVINYLLEINALKFNDGVIFVCDDLCEDLSSSTSIISDIVAVGFGINLGRRTLRSNSNYSVGSF